MPLTISTVQINTNLPGDGVSQPSKQDLASRKLHGESKGELVKGLPPLKHKVTPVVAIDQKHMQSLAELKALGSKRQKLLGLNGNKAAAMTDQKNVESFQYTPCDTKEDIETLLITSGNGDKPKDQADIKSSNVIKDELGSMVVQTESGLILDQVQTETKQSNSKWQKFGRRKEEVFKRDQHGTKVRKAAQLKVSKAKEYKHSRYADSPPESPPCAWDKWNAQDSPSERYALENISSDSRRDKMLLPIYSPTNYASLDFKEESLPCSDIETDYEVGHTMSDREVIGSIATADVSKSGPSDTLVARDKMLNTLFEEHQPSIESHSCPSPRSLYNLDGAHDMASVSTRSEYVSEAPPAPSDPANRKATYEEDFLSSVHHEDKECELRLDDFMCYNLDSDELMGHNVTTSFIAPSNMNLRGAHSWSSADTIRLQDDGIFSSSGQNLSITDITDTLRLQDESIFNSSGHNLRVTDKVKLPDDGIFSSSGHDLSVIDEIRLQDDGIFNSGAHNLSVTDRMRLPDDSIFSSCGYNLKVTDEIRLPDDGIFSSSRHNMSVTDKIMLPDDSTFSFSGQNLSVIDTIKPQDNDIFRSSGQDLNVAPLHSPSTKVKSSFKGM